MLTDEEIAKVAQVCGWDSSGDACWFSHEVAQYQSARQNAVWRNKLLPAGVFDVLVKMGFELHQDDENTEDWRCYQRRRYGGTEYPYDADPIQAITLALKEWCKHDQK